MKFTYSSSCIRKFTLETLVGQLLRFIRVRVRLKVKLKVTNWVNVTVIVRVKPNPIMSDIDLYRNGLYPLRIFSFFGK
jgi:hypothetical protein